MPLSWTLDHAGPIVRSVEDAALVLGVLAGHDPLDPRSLQADPFDPGAARAALPQPRLGLLVDFIDRADASVRAHLLEVVARLRDAGATVTEIRLRSSFDLYVAVHRLTMQAEAATVHAGWIARERQHYSPRIRAEAMVGQLLPGWVYLQSQPVRRRLAAETSELAADFDTFLLPTASNLAPGPETTGDPSFQFFDRLAVDQLTQRYQLRWTAVRRAARGPPPRRGDTAARRPPRGRSPGLQRPAAGLNLKGKR